MTEPTQRAPADTAGTARWCNWHKGPSSTAVAIEAIEVGSGPGAFLYACKSCREQLGLVPIDPAHREAGR